MAHPHVPQDHGHVVLLGVAAPVPHVRHGGRGQDRPVLPEHGQRAAEGQGTGVVRGRLLLA